MVNPTEIRPYGDTLDDGAVQLSFTLPVAANVLGKEVARELVLKMGFEKADVVWMEDLGGGFSFFVVYGKTHLSIDSTKIRVIDLPIEYMSREEIDEFVEARLGRPIVVVGATIESDAHTVGLDAILNMKGFHGDYGLERYHSFSVTNMGSQVQCEDLIRKALEVKADVVLVSQIVTQKNIHVQQMVKLVEMMEAEGVRQQFLLVAGGPRISHALALELGYDAGFGPGTLPSHVASFAAKHISNKTEAHHP